MIVDFTHYTHNDPRTAVPSVAVIRVDQIAALPEMPSAVTNAAGLYWYGVILFSSGHALGLYAPDAAWHALADAMRSRP